MCQHWKETDGLTDLLKLHQEVNNDRKDFMTNLNERMFAGP